MKKAQEFQDKKTASELKKKKEIREKKQKAIKDGIEEKEMEK